MKNQTSNYELNFEIPTNLIVKIDSFQFCQPYKLTKTISTGGETLNVTFIFKTGAKQEFAFDSNDIGQGKFNLQHYILCDYLLTDKLPNDITGYWFFTKSKLADIVLYYQKTVECEGFYYKEFTDKNPDMAPRDKRMKTGWNFVQYMEQRNMKE